MLHHRKYKTKTHITYSQIQHIIHIITTSQMKLFRNASNISFQTHSRTSWTYLLKRNITDTLPAKLSTNSIAPIIPNATWTPCSSCGKFRQWGWWTESSRSRSLYQVTLLSLLLRISSDTFISGRNHFFSLFNTFWYVMFDFKANVDYSCTFWLFLIQCLSKW